MCATGHLSFVHAEYSICRLHDSMPYEQLSIPGGWQHSQQHILWDWGGTAAIEDEDVISVLVALHFYPLNCGIG